ncbi:FHA domain-containing protein [Streptomyces ochraceiscleroticus]|uniref:FHA domain-containing protein n=1 Tax=Streptomyces ochraceiscleroticus TaxID=47761 RepID=A0ABW1MEJ7_9ACTN|nr:FHA domain-containing protein [Streptomyces ochraceiscleroticus]
MQIRLTVLGPRSGHPTRACDVLVTAPAGTALAAVASGLAAAVAGAGADVGGAGAGSGPVVLYAGQERLDVQRAALGEPPLIDGAVLSLQGPGPAPAHGLPAGPARLRVVSGPDAGGVHLLHGGQIRIGRSTDADVPLDDPDVSRMHCAVTVAADGAVTVADLRSTNGTAVDGADLDDRPVPLPPGALLRIGESALRLQPSPGAPDPVLAATPDGEGRLRVHPAGGGTEGQRPPHGTGSSPAHGSERHDHETAPGQDRAGSAGGSPAAGAWRAEAARPAGHGAEPPAAAGPYAAGTPGAEAYAAGARSAEVHSPDARATGRPAPDPYAPDRYGTDQYTPAQYAADQYAADQYGGDQYGTGRQDQYRDRQYGQRHDQQHDQPYGAGAGGAHGHPADGADAAPGPGSGRRGTPVRGTPAPDPRSAATHGGGQPLAAPSAPPGAQPIGSAEPSPGAGQPAGPEASRKPTRRGGGWSAWARRLAGGRGATEDAADAEAARQAAGYGPGPQPQAGAAPGALPGDARIPAAYGRWPDAATILLTALGPGPRLWEREAGHPDALAVRLGTADRDGSRSAVPVTVALRSAGSLGLAGPRPRLAGLARAAVAQLAALHAPGTLEIVLLAADRARGTAERLEEWSWLGWLPHVRPAHGQDCRLLLAYDKEQAAARTAELVRRLDDGPLGPGWASADRSAVAAAAARHQGPYTLVIADGDPGTAGLRETVARLAAGGPSAGIHVLALAETPAASPLYPLTATYEAARAASPAFGECGALAVLSGDVATALRVVQPAAPLAPGSSIAVNGVPQNGSGAYASGANGTVATVDAVSAPWAERFARALAPLREADTVRAGRSTRSAAVPLPDSARLLDELGLARATPASLMARWAAAADSEEPAAAAVLGAGPHGPVYADPAVDGCHFLLEGGPGTGKTELLRSIAASLAAADRPDLLSLVLVDGAGTERGEGLRLCTDLPHVTAHLAASDPVRMREFAQALVSELKRRAEILGGTGFAEWRAKHVAAPRVVAPRRSAEGRTAAAAGAAAEIPGSAAPGVQDSGLLDAPATNTLRLRPRTQGAPGAEEAERPAAAGEGLAAVSPMTRLFVIVDDFDALVAPALGSTGRPAAGSVVRALEAVAREGAALGVHLIAATGHPDRTAATATAERAGLRARLGAEGDPAEEPLPIGRGRLYRAADGSATPFQAGRVTGRIPRTSTLRPTVVPLEWHRMGDPPARRPLRELGNGPTDLALLASALQKAARSLP